ncbi:MgtC/SapB family protein [Desnuesiella massiliensis]|uniref:MgtC/SapB family protein n=1 Tax=Desnuesiella massiliensis TaxID=1650662 RepID=UPI0006E3E028|nr:MgtC/SapB family protein [Desnuesiella massiliensis]
MAIYEVVIRLLLAIIIAGAIGYEREFKNRPAGFRTHILVCVGAAVISMIQVYSIQDATNLILKNPSLEGALKSDIGRMGAQVVSGIGFLGAGTIIHEKGSIRGLTTAASLWVVGCLGLAIGMGYYLLSIFSGITVVMVLVSLKKLETRFFEKSNLVKIEVQYYDRKAVIDKLENYFNTKRIKVKNIEFALEDEEENPKNMSSLYTILVPKYISSSDILHDLMQNEEVIKVSVI